LAPQSREGVSDGSTGQIFECRAPAFADAQSHLDVPVQGRRADGSLFRILRAAPRRTALYHFLFVPLTLGLSLLLALMESVSVMTGRPVWREMDQILGNLVRHQFRDGRRHRRHAGVPVRHELGLLRHYVGDIFGAPLAIEGLMAFFLESTFIGLFFFGWERLSKLGHLIVTWLVAIGSNLSALWILIANAWMQHPVGAHFDPATMRMELSSFYDVLFNPVAQAKFVHTVSAGYVVTHFTIRVPWVLGLIATRSLDAPVEGIKELVAAAERHIRNGLVGYKDLSKLRAAHSATVPPAMQSAIRDFGYQPVDEVDQRDS
jgi:cytochrome bd-type quinol oxidase subunit 1